MASLPSVSCSPCHSQNYVVLSSHQTCYPSQHARMQLLPVHCFILQSEQRCTLVGGRSEANGSFNRNPNSLTTVVLLSLHVATNRTTQKAPVTIATPGNGRRDLGCPWAVSTGSPCPYQGKAFHPARRDRATGRRESPCTEQTPIGKPGFSPDTTPCPLFSLMGL